MGMKKILVVDYDQATLTALEKILAQEGYEVILASDGKAAWEKYNGQDPDLVLMEAMLPKIHGFELCQRITSRNERRVPVFIMTGVYKDRVYRTEALRSYGASEYFEKPLKIAEILTSIEAVIGKPEPEPVVEPQADPDLDPGYAEASAMAAAMHGAAGPEPETPEKPKPAGEDSRWILDLEKLEKEIPKIMACSPTASGNGNDGAEAANDLDLIAAALRSLPKFKADARGNGNNNGNGAEIDDLLKKALGDLDICDPKKPPAAKPQGAVPPAAPPDDKAATAAPAPTVEKAKAAPPSPAPAPSPGIAKVAPPKAAPSAQAPQVVGRQKSASPPPPPATPKPAPPTSSKPGPGPAPMPESPRTAQPAPRSPSWEKPAPAAAPQELRRSVIEDAKLRQNVPTGLFDGIHEKKSRLGLPRLLAGAAALAVLALAAFLLFRPKPPSASTAIVPPAAAAAMSETAGEQTSETPPEPPVVKKPAPKPQAQPPAPKKTSRTGDAREATNGSDGGAAAEDRASLIAPLQPEVNPGLDLQIPVDQQAGQPRMEAPPNKADERSATSTEGSGTAAGPPPSPAAPVQEGDLLDLMDVDQPPAVVKRVEPVYPQAAVRLRIEGPITVNALIDEAGKVLDTRILKGMKDDRGLEKAAETAVKKWKFEPALKNGVKVRVWMPVVVVFRLGDGEMQIIG